MKKDLQEIELTIEDVEDGCFAISMVKFPAMEDNFVALSEHEIELKVIDEDKRIVVGYAMIPKDKIYRRQTIKENGVKKEVEFYAKFTAQTIKVASEMYMKQLNLNNVTVEHEKKVSDVGIIESWITEDSKFDKINLYGIKPKVGGWAIMMKVNNDQEWEKVKDGSYRGFSIEGRFSGFENLMSKQNNMDIVEEIKALINAELKSEPVKLATIYDDLKGTMKEANKDFIDALGYRDKAITMCKLSLVKNQKLLSELKKAEGLIKQIGLDSELKKVTDAINQVNSNISVIDKTITEFMSI